MKNVFLVFILILILPAFAQDAYTNNENLIELSAPKNDILESNFNFTLTSTGINTKLTEVGSTFFKNKYIMYSSRKIGEIGVGKDKVTNEPYSNLYCLDIDKYGNLSKPLFFSRLIRSNGNQGGITFSPDEMVIYYTKSNNDNTSNYQLYKSDFDPVCRCKWVNEEPVVFNNTNYSVENPTVTSDGKKMYFSSNMPGGFGGFDLYIADINEFGLPINPINLGNTINTIGNESHPYITPNMKSLYFSSNGFAGFGGKDVFVSKIKKNAYSTPLNLGKTINTPSDEIAFIFASKNKGYVTSNRWNSIGSYDIYKFENTLFEPVLNGNVYESVSKIAMPNTKITLIDDEGTIVANQTTGEDGSYKFNVEPSEKYTVVANKEGYEKFELPVITAAVGNSKLDVALNQDKPVIVVKENKTVIAIEKIYFDFDKSSIKRESTLSLNKIVNVLTENPQMKISINAHTDKKGSDTYNLILSEKRAQETKKYLIKNGINPDRLSAKGFGETQSLSNCTNNCNETQNTADRRVEFVIQ